MYNGQNGRHLCLQCFAFSIMMVPPQKKTATDALSSAPRDVDLVDGGGHRGKRASRRTLGSGVLAG